MRLPDKLLWPFLWSVLAGMALYGALVIAGDLHTVWSAVIKLGLVGWLGILALSLINYGVRFGRWQRYLARLGYRVPPGPSLAYYIGAFAFTTTPGKAGEAVRSLYLKRHGVSYVHSLAALFAERFIDVVAMVLLASAAAIAFPEARWPVVALTGILLVVLPLVHSDSVHRFLDRQRGRLRSQRFQAVGAHLLNLLRSASALLRSGPLYAGLALGLIAWGAEGVAFHIILLSLDVHVSVALAIGIYAIAILAGALSFIPGGLGSTEAVMGLLLVLAGADTATAIAATLICRLATLWFAVAIGLVVVVGLEIRLKRDKAGRLSPVHSK